MKADEYNDAYFGNIPVVVDYSELDDEPFFILKAFDIDSDFLLTFLTMTSSTTTNDKRTPLHLACISDHLDEVEHLIAGKVSLDEKDALGRTALHLACWQRNCNIARILLEAGADLNALDLRNNTPLHLLCFGHWLTAHKGYVKLVMFMIDCGADLEVANKDGHYPFDFISDSDRRNQIKVSYYYIYAIIIQ